eukprot:3772121-Amphidinium_carterae.1
MAPEVIAPGSTMHLRLAQDHFTLLGCDSSGTQSRPVRCPQGSLSTVLGRGRSKRPRSPSVDTGHPEWHGPAPTCTADDVWQ